MGARQRPCLSLSCDLLESRQLLSGETITFAGQDNKDYVDANMPTGVHPDQFQDTHIHVINIPSGDTVQSVSVGKATRSRQG